VTILYQVMERIHIVFHERLLCMEVGRLIVVYLVPEHPFSSSQVLERSRSPCFPHIISWQIRSGTTYQSVFVPLSLHVNGSLFSFLYSCLLLCRLVSFFVPLSADLEDI
jgi:hypothetical protein